jgi:hypothetical protein
MDNFTVLNLMNLTICFQITLKVKVLGSSSESIAATQQREH